MKIENDLNSVVYEGVVDEIVDIHDDTMMFNVVSKRYTQEHDAGTEYSRLVGQLFVSVQCRDRLAQQMKASVVKGMRVRVFGRMGMTSESLGVIAEHVEIISGHMEDQL